MHEAGDYRIEGSTEDIAWLIGCPSEIVMRCVMELKRNHVADVTLGNGDVMLMSRRRQREVSSKEKNKLRVRKHRSNADVTLQSNKKEVISNKEEKEERVKSDILPKRSDAPASTAKDFAPPKNKPDKTSLFYHPAIEALRTITKHNPPKEAWPLLSDRLGVDVDVGKLAATVAEWNAAGNKPTNFTGIVDWYLGERRNGSNRTKQKRTDADVFAESAEFYKNYSG